MKLYIMESEFSHCVVAANFPVIKWLVRLFSTLKLNKWKQANLEKCLCKLWYHLFFFIATFIILLVNTCACHNIHVEVKGEDSGSLSSPTLFETKSPLFWFCHFVCASLAVPQASSSPGSASHYHMLNAVLDTSSFLHGCWGNWTRAAGL